MEKNSTLFSNASFISACHSDLKDQAFSEDQFTPGDAVIANILAFSNALRIEKSRTTGLIEVVLN